MSSLIESCIQLCMFLAAAHNLEEIPAPQTHVDNHADLVPCTNLAFVRKSSGDTLRYDHNVPDDPQRQGSLQKIPELVDIVSTTFIQHFLVVSIMSRGPRSDEQVQNILVVEHWRGQKITPAPCLALLPVTNTMFGPVEAVRTCFIMHRLKQRRERKACLDHRLS